MLDIASFLDLKNHSECAMLDDEIINAFLDSFNYNTVKKYKKNYTPIKKTNQILKNPKIKLIKEKISNKVNLILNKLSDNNLQNLLTEFFQNVKIITIDDYNEFIKTIYIKMLLETNFLTLYFSFFKTIINTYSSLFNWEYSYFYDLVESKFKMDYSNETFDIDFLNDYSSENYRINNLNIIKEMVSQQFFNNNFIKKIEDLLLTQNKYLCDIYHWFKNTEINKDIEEKINNILLNEIQIRDKVLLQNLIPCDTNKKKIIFKKKYITIESKIENILNENIDSIQQFINLSCSETNEKNKFCEVLINIYYKSNNTEKYIDLIKVLITKQILFKSNFSRGLINNLQDINISPEKEKSLLVTLKNLGITKGLESLLTKHSI